MSSAVYKKGKCKVNLFLQYALRHDDVLRSGDIDPRHAI